MKTSPMGRLAALIVIAPWLVLAGCATTAPDQSQSASASTSPLPDSAEETEERRRARIRLELAATYYQQGNYAVALQELRQALAIEPNYPQALAMLGLVSMDLGDNARAEESFQRALRLAPADSDINNNYGWFLCNTGREKESLEHFQRALRNPLYTTPSRPLHNAGICSLRLGDEQAAEQYFLRAFQFDPRNPVAMFNLGEIYLKRRDAERARFYSQRLVSAYDPTAQVLWLALRIERLAGNAEGEASLAAQLRRRFPASPQAARLARGEYGE